jgi:hypothetical protein
LAHCEGAGVTGFVFDAKAALARIGARRAGGTAAAVSAVVGVARRETLQEPQKPQESQRGRTGGGATTLAGKPQEPQQPQGPSDSMREADSIEERAAIIFGTCPAEYADVFARLNHQKPIAVSGAQWSRAVDDAGRFLDVWGADAAALQWSTGDLFDVPREGRGCGLVWQSRGERVEALGADHARLSDGRVIASGGIQRDEINFGEPN